MPYTIVLSGPESTRAKAVVALETARIPVYPDGHHAPMDWKAKFPDDPAGTAYLTVRHEDVNVPVAAVEKAGWVLRVHYHEPDPPAIHPDDVLAAKLAEYESRIGRLEAQLSNPPMMGGAVESPAFANQNQTYSAEKSRRAWFAWAARTGSNAPGIIAGGLLSSADLQLSAPVSGMSTNVSTGECIVGGSEGGAQGGYYARATSQTNLVISAANVTNPRIDTVCATISDSGYTEPSGGSGDQWALQVVTGTPTASASLTNLLGAASLPLSSLLLGYVLVPANATNIITADLSNVAGTVQGQSSQREWAYAQITSTVLATDTSESTATAIITAPAFTPDGGPVLVEFFAPFVTAPSTTTGTTIVTLFEGATQICRLALVQNSGGAAAALATPTTARYRFTPTATAHTYKVCAVVSATTGNPQVGAGVGGTGAYAPAYVRITKV